jgi:hypothetical protein
VSGGAAIAALLLLAPAAAAQRMQAQFEWQERAVVLEYGKVSVGKHSLDELHVGETWRMGANAITTLRTTAPLITADAVIPPGHYRAWIARPTDDRYELQVDGAGRWMAAGGDHATITGVLTKAAPPSTTLEIALELGSEQKDPELRSLACKVTYGAPRLVAELTIVGSASKKVGGATVDWFKLPSPWLAERVELAKHTPVASVTWAKAPKEGPQRFNLLVSDRDARLVPQETPPTAEEGRGPMAEETTEYDHVGTATWSDQPEAVAHLVVDTIELDPKKALRLVARTGKRKVEILVPLAPAK